MRVIGGFLGGRKINPPSNKWPTRPTTDFTKESLYNILSHKLDFESIAVCDLFGGMGNHSFECVSRGCTDVTYVDSFKACSQFVRLTAQEWGIEKHIQIITADAFKFIATSPKQFDFIYADPPYDHPKLPQLADYIFNGNILKPNGLLVIEHDKSTLFNAHTHLIDNRKYGATILSFFT